MNINSLATTIVSGVLALALIIGTVVMSTAGVDVPEYFANAIQIFGGAAVGASFIGNKS